MKPGKTGTGNYITGTGNYHDYIVCESDRDVGFISWVDGLLPWLQLTVTGQSVPCWGGGLWEVLIVRHGAERIS